MKMSGRIEVMATQGGTVGDAPPKSQCKIQSLASSSNPVACFFFLLGSFAPALTNLISLDTGVLRGFLLLIASFRAETRTLTTESCLKVYLPELRENLQPERM